MLEMQWTCIYSAHIGNATHFSLKASLMLLDVSFGIHSPGESDNPKHWIGLDWGKEP